MYLAPTIACVALALSSGDPKSRFVLLQLPVGRQMWVLRSMGLSESLYGISWPALYLLLCVPVVVLLYLAGWSLTRFCGGVTSRHDRAAP